MYRAALFTALVVSASACADVRGPGGPRARMADDEPAAFESASYQATTEAEEEPSSEGDTEALEPEPASRVAPGPAKKTVHPYQAAVVEARGESAATRYAGLSERDCTKELKQRSLPIEPSKEAAGGVASPLRVKGPMHGVRILTAPAPSKFGILDCRMALALDDLAKLAATHDVVEIRIDSFYRANAKIAGRKKKSQHSHALAADIVSFKLADGRMLTVPDDWHAEIGTVACGPDAVLENPDDDAIALRNLVCDVARSGVFHHVLTPSYNAAHQSHFHFDIERGAKGSRVK